MKYRLGSILLAVLVGGCASTPEPEQPAELQELENQSLTTQVVWKRDTGTSAGDQVSGFQLAVDGRRIYTANRDGVVTALNLEDGKRAWRAYTDLRMISGPSVAEGILLVGTRDGQVVALSSDDGSEIWRVEVTSEVLAAPAVGENSVAVRTLDGRLVVFDLDDGDRRFTVQRSVPTLTARGVSSPVIVNDVVLAGLDNGKVIALDLFSGELRWEQRVAAPTGRSELERIVDIDASLLVADNEVYAVSAGGQLASLSLTSGRVRWRREITSRSGISFNPNQVFVSDVDGTVWSLSRSSGALAWKQDALAYRQLSPPAMNRGYVLVGDYEGYLHWLIPEDGTVVARAHPVGDAIRAAPLVIGKRVLVLSADGDVVALETGFKEQAE